jgi:hypothetical protein
LGQLLEEAVVGEEAQTRQRQATQQEMEPMRTLAIFQQCSVPMRRKRSEAEYQEQLR